MSMRSASRERRVIDAPQLALLRGFELRCYGASISLPRSAQRLLAFLALHPRPVLRGYVAGNLWLESDDEHAHASLRSALWRLQRPGCGLVNVTDGHLALATHVTLDVRMFCATAREVLRAGSAPSPSNVAVLCEAGDLLPDWYEDWLAIERERLRQLRLHALDAACERLRRAERFSEATEVGLAAVAAEPLRESAHRALIDVHLAERNVAEAIRQYDLFRRLVATHLGTKPSRELQDLLETTTARA
jgi:DNA-binding SARP family transcriptional activator